MRANIHPAIRRIVWLIILIGALADVIAAIAFLFNLGPGITLPFTKAALDVGWLFVFGFMWLAVGILLLWWLRPVTGVTDESDNVQRLEAQFRQFQAAQDARLADLDTRLTGLASQLDRLGDLGVRLSGVEKLAQGMRARLERLDDAGAISQRPHDLDSELGSLATTLQDAHRRIDSLGDVNARLDELASQLDALYVTVQDAHRRIDGLEQRSNR
jgi:uncharacterized membrane protein YccC